MPAIVEEEDMLLSELMLELLIELDDRDDWLETELIEELELIDELLPLMELDDMLLELPPPK